MPLPRAGLAQSLYCWGLHTGEFPRIEDENGARERPLGYPHSLLPTDPCPLPGICIIRHPHFRAT